MFSSCFQMLLICCFVCLSLGSSLRFVNMYDEVSFKGCCKRGQNTSWTFGNIFISFNRIVIVNSNLKDSISLDHQSTLQINPVTLVHEGFYKCICNNLTITNYTLVVEGKYILVNLFIFILLLKIADVDVEL